MDSDEQRVSNGSMDGSIRGMYLGGMYLNSSHWSHPKIPSTRHAVLVKSGSTKDINTQNYSRGNIRSIVYLQPLVWGGGIYEFSVFSIVRIWSKRISIRGSLQGIKLGISDVLKSSRGCLVVCLY